MTNIRKAGYLQQRQNEQFDMLHGRPSFTSTVHYLREFVAKLQAKQFMELLPDNITLKECHKTLRSLNPFKLQGPNILNSVRGQTEISSSTKWACAFITHVDVLGEKWLELTTS